MKKSTTGTAIIIVVLVVLVVGYYAYLSNQSRESHAQETLSQVQSTLSRDLDRDYPPTPKEVLKYYNEIVRCLYNEDSTEEEIEALGLQARGLYDQELLANNELGSYLIRLQDEVQVYRAKERKIINANVASSVNTDTFERNGFTFAKLKCDYIILEGKQKYTTSQMFLLRKDSEKRWKIYGWEDVNNLNSDEE